MHESLFKELRFQIGEQYELNEFNLQSIGSTFENGLEYENYEYIKNDFVALFGIPLSKNVVLQYNGEILMRVIFEFDIKYSEVLLKKFETRNLIPPEKNSLGKTICLLRNHEILVTFDLQRSCSLFISKILG